MKKLILIVYCASIITLTPTLSLSMGSEERSPEEFHGIPQQPQPAPAPALPELEEKEIARDSAPLSKTGKRKRPSVEEPKERKKKKAKSVHFPPDPDIVSAQYESHSPEEKLSNTIANKLRELEFITSSPDLEDIKKEALIKYIDDIRNYHEEMLKSSNVNIQILKTIKKDLKNLFEQLKQFRLSARLQREIELLNEYIATLPEEGPLKKIKSLLKEGINAVDEETGDTALLIAVRDGDMKIITKLLKLSPEAVINHINHYNETPLIIAARDGNIKIVKRLLKRGARVNYEEIDSPISYAAQENHTEIVQLLLENGANVNESDVDENTPLHDAVRNNNLELAKILIRLGANLDSTNSDDATPLIEASQREYAEMVKLLLESGADWTIQGYDGETAYDFGNDEIKQIIDEFKKSDMNKFVEPVEEESEAEEEE